MGLFDLFKNKITKSSPPPSMGAPGVDKNLARLAKQVSDRLAQTYTRIEAIQELAKLRSSEAAAALLRRFTIQVEPSMTDHEEKELVLDTLIDFGPLSLGPIRTFCERAESVGWPIKALQAMLEEESFVQELVGMLEGYDTDYARNVDPKIQLLGALEGKKFPQVIEGVSHFLEDVSEPVRFQTITTLLSLEDPAVVEPLARHALTEESVRVRNLIRDGLRAHGWQVPDELRESFEHATRTVMHLSF